MKVKRISRLERARIIRDIALPLVYERGQFVKIGNTNNMRMRLVTLDYLQISAWDEFSCKALATGGGDYARGLEIRLPTGKVFVIYWKPAKKWADPEYIMLFNCGDWEQALLKCHEALAGAPG